MTDTDRIYRLLIVDDDETDRRHYRRLLVRHALGGCDIEQAADGAAGLAALRDRTFDCVLLDFNLPDMNGLEFLSEVMSGSEPPCAVVLITGQGSEAIAVKAMKLGVQDYVVKSSLSDSKLWDAMIAAVNQRELHQRLNASVRDLRLANLALTNEIAARETVEVELRAAKEAAEEASRAKTQFVAMITHELRTPLNGILGYAQLLGMEGGLSGKQHGRVDKMLKAGKHLLEMVEQVLDFATIDVGRMRLHSEVVSIHELAEGCIDFIGPMATEHGLDLRLVNAHEGPRTIAADPARLRQVLLNLLGNAVKFTRVGSVELRLLAGVTKGNLRLEVADTGPGINEKIVRERLFQDFERFDAGNPIEGAGLGLAISARIVGLMGGTIGYRSNEGGGSVFWLELPTGDIISASLSITAPVTPPGVLPSRHVLLVDDIAMNREVIGAFLHTAGYELKFAENGQEAVRLASEEVFDVILMDVRMPEMDGLEATGRIRALSGPRALVPILGLTAYSFPEQVIQCRNAGMDGHIFKPVDYAELSQAITDVLSRATDWTETTPALLQANMEEQATLTHDRSMFDQLRAIIGPESIDANLRELRRQKREILLFLEHRAPCSLLANAAHALASSAGMFGFTAFSVVARYYERAVTNNSPEVEKLAQRLLEEVYKALELLDIFIDEGVEATTDL